MELDLSTCHSGITSPGTNQYIQVLEAGLISKTSNAVQTGIFESYMTHRDQVILSKTPSNRLTITFNLHLKLLLSTSTIGGLVKSTFD